SIRARQLRYTARGRPVEPEVKRTTPGMVMNGAGLAGAAGAERSGAGSTTGVMPAARTSPARSSWPGSSTTGGPGGLGGNVSHGLRSSGSSTIGDLKVESAKKAATDSG